MTSPSVSPFASTGTPLYSEVIYKSRYARYLPEAKRREEWNETVCRYVEFMQNHIRMTFGGDAEFAINWGEIWQAIHDLEVMPSMRALMAAGPALERDHVAGYNCAYLPIIDLRCFDEAMFILMCGTGVGFSVERQYINRLPEVPAHLMSDPSVTIVFHDSKEGWADGFRSFLDSCYGDGVVPNYDLTNIRPAGAPLRTFGGRASGPAPLDSLLRFTRDLLLGAAGRKLTSIECHDLMCKIAEVVVVGGVRRSALISLSNLTDERMRHAKDGQWWQTTPHRALANNSVAYTETPDTGVFLREWLSLFESKSGERGIFNREAARLVSSWSGRRNDCTDFGTNPCSEIILRPFQFCNLSEVVARHTDTPQSLARKVRIASIIGTVQATLDSFRYIRPEWKENAETERLLGVSITGINDCPAWSGHVLEALRSEAQVANGLLAAALGINPSVAITCVKPSGTVSQLVNASSGIHPRYAEFYIRRVRFDVKDPMAQFLTDNGVPCEVDQYNPSALVFSFPVASPMSVTRHDVSAIEQLQTWEDWQVNWCEHKPSITVYVRDEEWVEVAAWVHKNFEIMSGVSFLPFDNGSYVQAPYEEITEEKYRELAEAMPKSLDWTAMSEMRDDTSGSQELACTGGACEL